MVEDTHSFALQSCKKAVSWYLGYWTFLEAKKVKKMLIYDTVPLQMKKIEKTTSICAILCVISWQSSANTRSGQFLVENPDTG